VRRPGRGAEAMGQAVRTSGDRRRGNSDDFIGVLDIGTSKVCCLIVTASSPHRLLGLGQQRAQGVTAGLVVDLEAAEQAVRTAVARAEHQAGVTLQRVHIGVTGGQLASHHFVASADVASGVVGNSDIDRLHVGARAYCSRDGRVLVHMNRIAYRLDGSAGVRDPRGMAGRTLAGDMHAVTAD
jgi:cell division protein FtsA